MKGTSTWLLPALLLALAGCSGLLRETAAPPGNDAATPHTGTLASSTGCTLHYRRFDAAPRARSGDLVVLAHGFLRSQERMRVLARAIAADGVDVVTLDFCNPRPWNGRHVQNARDMQALARAQGARRVVYAGFSAGALAAVVAARLDPTAIGVVALDLVDTGDVGVRAARGLDKPVLGLAGEPTNCNAMGNGRGVYAAAERARVVRIRGAGHCDFEGPTDGICELLCEDPGGRADAEAEARRARIIASAAAAVEALLEGEPDRWPAGNAATAGERIASESEGEGPSVGAESPRPI